jgi:hypothetical protein
MMYDIVIPPAFCTDHSERDGDIPSGGVMQSRGYKCRLNEDQLGDLLSDAVLYSDCGGGVWDTGPYYLGLGRSARATVKRCEAALIKHGPPEGPDLPSHGYDDDGVYGPLNDWGKYLREQHAMLYADMTWKKIYIWR